MPKVNYTPRLREALELIHRVSGKLADRDPAKPVEQLLGELEVLTNLVRDTQPLLIKF